MRTEKLSASQPNLKRRTLLLASALLALSNVGQGRTEGVSMRHIVLLGDSVFDNKAYVGGGPDVIQQLRSITPAEWQSTLTAVDGALTADVKAQLKRVPSAATHLVVSAGGNDALREAGVLDQPARSVAEALEKVAAARDRFRRNYAAMLDQVAMRGLPTAVCTIYEPRFPEPQRRRLAATALAILNDCITREAFSRGLTLIDLRVLLDEVADFANPIEPSVRGGMKLARAALQFSAQLQDEGRVIARLPSG